MGDPKDLQNQNDLSSDEQYLQGSNSGQLAAATDNIAGSSSGLESFPLSQHDPGMSNRFNQSAPLLSDGLQYQNNLSSEEQYLQGSRSGQPINFATATDSFVAGFSSELYQESNLGPSNQYHQSGQLMFDDLHIQNDLGSNEQYPQGSHSGQPISFAATTSSFIAGSSSGLYQESNPGPSKYYFSVPLVANGLQYQNNLSSDEQYPHGIHSGMPMSFAAATNNIAGYSSGQYQESLPSTQYNPGPSNQSAPLVSDGLQNQNNLINDEQYLALLPPGYRFRPTDLELVECYLPKKVTDSPLPRNRIWNINVYEHDPDGLTGFLPLLRETEWYFFSSRKKKYAKGNRPDLATPGGYWKPTAAGIDICDRGGKVVGKKRVLDFYKGKSKHGEKKERTTWKMHEYVLPKGDATASSNNGNDMLLDNVVLCKIYKIANTQDVPNGSNLRRATARTNLQGEGSTSSTTCEQREDHPSHQTDLRSAQCNPGPSTQYQQSASLVSGLEVTEFGTATNISSFPGGLCQNQSTPSVPGVVDSTTIPPTVHQPDHRGDGSTKYTTCEQPMSFAPATNNITVSTSALHPQYNLGPSNRYQQLTHLVSGLRDTSSVAAMNNISCFPDRASRGGFWNPTGGDINICDCPGKKIVLDIYNGKPKERNWRTNWNSAAPGNNMRLDNLERATGSNLQGDGSTSSAYHQGGHSGQPISFSPATDNMAGFPSWQCQEYNQGPTNEHESALLVSGLGVTSLATTSMNGIPSYPSDPYQESFLSTQYNMWPSNQNQQPTPLMSGLEVTSLATTMNNITGSPSVPHQESFPSTQCNMGPSNQNHHPAPLVSGLKVTTSATTTNVVSSPCKQHQESLPSTQCNTGTSNPYQLAILELAHGVTGFGTAENISKFPGELRQNQYLPVTQHDGLEPYNFDQEQMPSLVTGNQDNNNVKQLPSHLDHHSTVPGVVNSTTTLSAIHQLDDCFNELAEALQDPSLRGTFDSSINPKDLSKDKNDTDGKR